MRWMAIGLALALPLSGCLGSDDDGLEPTNAPTPDVPDEAPQPAPTASRVEEVHEGSVTTVNFVQGSVNVGESDTIVEFAVPKGSTVLTVNVTADGGGLDVLVAEPGCDPNSECEQAFATEGGTLSIEFEGPADGTWTLRFFGNEPGPSTVAYTAEIAVVEVHGAPDAG